MNLEKAVTEKVDAEQKEWASSAAKVDKVGENGYADRGRTCQSHRILRRMTTNASVGYNGCLKRGTKSCDLLTRE